MILKSIEETIMSAIVTKVTSVTPFGENLSQVNLENGKFIIANRKEDGSFRWAPDEVAVYVSENSVVPDDVLKDRGYWDHEKNKGLLGGNKGNRVKGRNFGPEDDRRRSVGLLFKVSSPEGQPPIVCNPVDTDDMYNCCNVVNIGDDVSKLFGITE